MTGKDILLTAFDELFEAAITRLDATVTADERQEARAQFGRRFAGVLDVVGTLDVPELPREALDTMKGAIGELSPAELAGMVASIPLAQQTQEMLRVVAVQQAQQKMLEQLAMQADTRWGN
ncbi:MAG TPA: hypothetical protein VGR62_06470 [Candidatus Binatia bacterium]|jgi:hypothetical protein|nr:hypothetical protein [Candidatus Binatia bacterium]